MRVPYLLLTLLAVGARADLTLVKDHQSKYVIFHAEDAVGSVVDAANELQSYLARCTGAKLPIVTAPQSPMVSLGLNDRATAAGLTLDGIPLEGYRCVTRGQDLFIYGPDTADGERTPQGGTSAGTRNGVYAFLEEQVGVRFLTPGEHGDWLPQLSDLTIPEQDKQDAPFFLNRRLPYTQQNREDVKRWWARQGLGLSLNLSHGHNWHSIPPGEFQEHPDWFAMRGGVRVPPTGRYKLCVTNPGLIDDFAQRAIRFFDEHPDRTCYSLSPADSAGWCECDQCKALYETDPNGNLSVTPAILRFYNEVGQRVAVKYPDKVLAGYVYAAYVFPPKVPIKLQSNVFLVWAPSFDYGFTLHRPALREQWETLVAQWTKVTDQIAYYDLPFNLSTESGALNPPGLKILKFLYPRLKQAEMKGVYVYGIEAWGRGGPLNYLLAKLAWNPDAEVDALFSDYCDKAYGRGAPEMEQLWLLLDQAVEEHFVAHPEARYTLTNDMLKEIYAARWPELERLYRAAEAKVTDPDAKARLQMVGDNLTVCCWNLRQYKLLPEAEQSSFYLPDADFFKFMAAHRGSLALHPSRDGGGNRKVPKLLLARAENVPNASETQLCYFRGDQHFVLYPTGDADAVLSFRNIAARGKLVRYSLCGADGEEIAAGLLSAEVPLTLDGAGSAYYHLFISAGSASFAMNVKGAAWAANGRLTDQGLHFLGKVTPLYFEVPAGLKSFHLSLEATPPGETAVATLYRPDGTEAAKYDCTAKSVDLQAVDAVPGWWKLVIEPAPVGVLDDVYVMAGEELSGWFSTEPGGALGVKVAE